VCPSQSDPLEGIQYHPDEIEAVCQEAMTWGKYVGGPRLLPTRPRIFHGLLAGARTIKHGNLIDAEAAGFMAERGAFLVPTLAPFDALRWRGKADGVSDSSLAKNEIDLKSGFRSLELAHAAGVEIGFGSDLVSQHQNDHRCVFLLRRQTMSPQEILRPVTIVNARILKREGQLGEFVPGAFSDRLVVDGNPQRDIGIFADGGPNLSVIMNDGRFRGGAWQTKGP